ncbi:hypothetical protein INT45_010725 [Circinella minor]|uniref:Uncharacterized protein n=1 Tax=Circinella minor TaxID=1195481 RepID=A0A8H7RSE3_9FUNG|nr:hypothetical protein INT45_010725 [Circinella minor]
MVFSIGTIVVNAACTCSASDTVCLEKCVSSANNCIQNCQGSNDCYTGCVDQYWPTTAIATASIPTTATASASGSVSASASVSQTQAASHQPSSAANNEINQMTPAITSILAMIMSLIFYH